MSKIKIELFSDLCVGSGYSYGRIIDADVVYDTYGFPYIPSRRLKGCLREAAESLVPTLLSKEDIIRIFGKWGENQNKGIRIGNAVLPLYREYVAEIEKENGICKPYLEQHKIINLYTQVKAQTTIDDKGIAKDNSLRYTRIIQEYLPMRGHDRTSFEAEIDWVLCEDVADLEEKMQMICKALRHIGMSRTRGLGNVRCTYLATQADNENITCNTYEADKCYRLYYHIENEEPLMLSDDREDVSGNYIKGQMIEGALAAAYLSKREADTRFEELFVNGNVLFSNLYVSDGKDIYYPAPLCIAKYKKSGEYLNLLEPVERKETDTPKPLRGKYLTIKNKDAAPYMKERAVAIETIYHHRTSDRQLYMLQAISPGQQFGGYIEARGKDLAVLQKMLLDSTLYLGKSRSAQYGKCKILSTNVEAIQEIEQQVKKADRYIVCLQSDTLFASDCNGVTIETGNIEQNIAEALGNRTGFKLVDGSLRSGVCTGYYGKWNLKKTSQPMILGGGVLEIEALEDATVKTCEDGSFYVGTGNKEGFGFAKLYEKEAFLRQYVAGNARTVGKESDKAKCENGDIKELCRLIIRNEIEEKKKQEALNLIVDVDNASTLGRITLMLQESLAEHECVQEQFRDYCGRVSDIKALEKDAAKMKKFAEKVFEDLKAYANNQEDADVSALYTVSGDPIEDICSMWGTCMMTAFVTKKYQLAKKKGDK